MYHNILFAVEFTETAHLAGKKIKKIAEVFHAQLHLIHIVELPQINIFPDIPNKEKLYIDEAKNRLAGIGKNLNVPLSHQHVDTGNPRIVIPEFIEQHRVDLLIVGHNERHGIDRILGSTTYAILERTKCEVLVMPYRFQSTSNR
ncbi:MAG: universal stress protein [Gammaproteobacteria bacterium]|nr:universal stress protein [Gammaproteobacteria bacterium]MCW5584064.1 universal stress protein [Gammaproteobacteria bacterium]